MTEYKRIPVQFPLDVKKTYFLRNGIECRIEPYRNTVYPFEALYSSGQHQHGFIITSKGEQYIDDISDFDITHELSEQLQEVLQSEDLEFIPGDFYETRGGRIVQLMIKNHHNKTHPLIFIIICNGCIYDTTINGEEYLRIETSDLDIIRKHEPKKEYTRDVWFSFYPDGEYGVTNTLEEANAYSDDTRIACIKVTVNFTEGQGL